ncbi:MAG: hypothetical protein EOQ28_04260 [Mesorhizobium sp.]|uniref:hypothetical protein n=1 Tax=Mesorhizobium sp. TaxID=1871066 RepID=UPI000FE7710A|nr:hypothetical protein [Mesorhizobium sp.]RWA76902.1 MAG: hypothetical protein EOQ28_04260 [Mesorhizobium sp.]RWC04854.1 MAG: hypothetical protein EOQ57_04495 [Mesorhizobium sp.]
MERLGRFDFRSAIVVVASVLIFSLLIGRPFFPVWFKLYALPLALLVFIGMFGLVALYNKISTGIALLGPKKSVNIKRSHIALLILIFTLPFLKLLFHLIQG